MKKLNKFFAVLVALAMMAMLSVATAFATPANKSDDVALAVLTKDFQVPDGVTSPAATFKYKFDLQSKPASATTEDFDATITFAQDTGDQLGLLYLKDVAVFNYDNNGLLQTGSRLTQPGEYVFLVTECGLDDGSSFTKVNTNATENIDMDGQTYTLRVYVVNSDDGLKVSNITVQKGEPKVLDEENEDLDTQEEVDAANDGAKVDPDDVITTDDNDTPEDTSDDTITHNGSDFKFTNTYSKTLGNDPSDDETDPDLKDAAVAVRKTVTGSGDTAYAFPFTASITIPDEMKKDAEQTFTATYGEKTVTFTVEANATTSDTQNFALANGETLKFATFPAGAKLTVNENVATSEAQNGDLYTGNAAGLGDGATYGKGAALVYTTNAVDAQGKVTVTNNLDASDITPTGILINNLPYIALALVAIGGLVAYVVIRRKNADEA